MPPDLQLNLLGIPEVYIDKLPVAFETNKSQALLFYLALNPGWHSRDLLAELLWPDMTTSRARKNLRDGLTQLRVIVSPWLVTDTQRVEFVSHLPYNLDIQHWQEGLTEGQTTLNLALVEQAIKLYRGDFLMGFHVRKAHPFEEWVLQKREELHIQFINGLEWLTQQYFAKQDYQASLSVNRQLLKAEPWRESAHQLQMRLLALLGLQNEALMQYKNCQRILVDELDVEPAPETVALYEQIRTGKFAPPAAESPTITPAEKPGQPVPKQDQGLTPFLNLPRQMTPLIGREMETS